MTEATLEVSWFRHQHAASEVAQHRSDLQRLVGRKLRMHMLEEDDADDDIRKRSNSQKCGDEPSEVVLELIQREHLHRQRGDREAAQASEEGEDPQRVCGNTRQDGLGQDPQSVSEIGLQSRRQRTNRYIQEVEPACTTGATSPLRRIETPRPAGACTKVSGCP